MSQYESFHLWGEGRFCYDDEKVNRSKDLIKEAEKALDSTKENIAKGFSSLLAAANIDRSPDLAENIRTNEPVIEKFPEECVSYMEELYKMVNSKQEEIEEYKNSSGWDKFWSTVGMGTSKFLEGIASVGENIVDAGATLVGCVGGLFNSDFQDSCAEFIKKDHVGEAFHNFNEWSEINKYSAMSENGTMAKIFKGVGVATGYAIVGSFTGGALGVSATTANTLVAAAGGLGSGMEEGLQEGKDWDGALAQGGKQMVIQGGTAFAMGKLSEKIQTNRAMKADGGKNKQLVEDAAKQVKDSKAALAKARHEYAMNNHGTNAKGLSTKAAVKAAKEDLRGALNAQQYVEKQAIAGANLTKDALQHTTSDSFLYNLGEKTGKIAGKAGENANKLLTKVPGVKTVEKIATKSGSLAMDGGTKVINGTSKVANKVIGKPVDFIAGKTANLIDAGSKAGKTVSGTTSSLVQKIPGSQAVSKFANDHKVLAAAVKLPGEATVGIAKTAATSVVKSPGIVMSIGNEARTIDRQVIHNELAQRAAVDSAAERTIGKEMVTYDGIFTGSDVDYGNTPAATDNGSTGYTDTGYTPSTSSTSDSGYTAYQPSVAARQASSSGGGYTAGSYSSGGGTTYTPSYTATTTSPAVQTADVAKTTSPLSDTNYTRSNLYDTTPSTNPSTGESTGNSNAVVDTFTNTSGGSTSGGSSYTYEEPVRSTTSYSSSGTTHSGGGYSDSGYSFGGSEVGSYSDTATSIDPTDLITEDTGMSSSGGTLASSITSTNKFSNQTIKIPSSSESISSGGSNMAIPTAAAFSAAAAAGIGAKAFIDKKQREKEENDEAFSDGNENAGFSSENWEGSEDDIKVDYGTEEEETLDDDNNYSADSIIEKYEAVSNSELEEA